MTLKSGSHMVGNRLNLFKGQLQRYVNRELYRSSFSVLPRDITHEHCSSFSVLLWVLGGCLPPGP